MASALSGAGDRFERRGLGVVRCKIELPRFGLTMALICRLTATE